MTSWPSYPLGDVADIAAGITLGRKTKVANLVEVPYLRVANVQDGRLDLAEVKTIAATPKEIERLRLQEGDLLLTEGGDPDKLGRGTCWGSQLADCIHQNHIFRVRIDERRYDPEFVSLQVGSPYGKQYFLRHAKKTTGIATINQGVLRAFPLISPPLSEQRDIAARLKAQLAEVETARRAAQAQLRDLAVVSSRLLSETFAHSTTKPLALDDVLIRVETGRSFKTTETRAQPSELGVLKVSAVSWSAFRPDEAKAVIPGYQPEEHHRVQRRDLLISRANTKELVGAVVLVEDDYPYRLLSDKTLRLVIDESSASKEYLVYALRAPAARKHLEHFATGTSDSMRNVSQPVIKQTPVHLPPVEEQVRITAALQAQFAEVETARQAAQLQLREIESLPSRLLGQAFAVSR